MGRATCRAVRGAHVPYWFQPTPSSYGEGDSSGPHTPTSPPLFQPTPSSYGEGDVPRIVEIVDAPRVSTHALLIWGGRPPARGAPWRAGEVSTHALLIWG